MTILNIAYSIQMNLFYEHYYNIFKHLQAKQRKHLKTSGFVRSHFMFLKN